MISLSHVMCPPMPHGGRRAGADSIPACSGFNTDHRAIPGMQTALRRSGQRPDRHRAGYLIAASMPSTWFQKCNSAPCFPAGTLLMPYPLFIQVVNDQPRMDGSEEMRWRGVKHSEPDGGTVPHMRKLFERWASVPRSRLTRFQVRCGRWPAKG